MKLNREYTALLQIALQEEERLFYFAKKCMEFFQNAEYDTFRNYFIAWSEAYAEGDLFGTDADGNAFQFSGIDQFPIPPER